MSVIGNVQNVPQMRRSTADSMPMKVSFKQSLILAYLLHTVAYFKIPRRDFRDHIVAI